MNFETEILGRRVHGSVPPDVAAWVTTQLAESPATKLQAAVVPSTFSIALATRLEPVPCTIADRATWPTPLGTRLFGDDAEFWILERVDGTEQGVHAEFANRGVRLSVVGAPFRAWTALRQAFHEVLMVSGVVRMHAAVVGKGPHVVALLGPSGRGKSTTLVRAVSGGWRPLCEDAAFLDVASLTLVSADELDYVRMRPALPEPGVAMPDSVTPRQDGDRMRIDFAELGGRVPSARLTHLARLVRTSDPTPRWRPLTRADAVMALHEAVGVPASRRTGQVLGTTFGDVVGRVGLLTLELGAASELVPDLPAD